MVVPFKNIPQNLRVPLFYAEVDNSQANSGQQTQRALIIGQKTSAGNGVVDVPVICSSEAQAITLGGIGSMLHLMVKAYRAADPSGELWVLPVADNGSGTAAAGSINFTAAATSNGTLNLYIAGLNVPLPVASTQTAAQLATALAGAINANGSLPVTAAVDGMTSSKVDITAKNAGVNGNTIDIRTNYYGAANGEVDPAGLAYTIVAMASGATNPVLATALANIATQSYDFIVQPYTDTTSMTSMSAYLNDTAGTWSWEEQFYGHAFTAFVGTLSAIITKTTSLNDQHTTVLGYNNSPTPDFVVAADLAGTAAPSIRADPARPLQALAMSTMLPPPLASRFALTDRNTLLYDGCSTFNVAQDGTILLENIITTYQKNGFSQPDDSYLEIETMFTLVAVLRTLASVVTSRYARVKLAADGTKFAAGSAIVTPSTIKSDLIAEYQQLEYNGLVQNTAAFAQALIVEQNATNPNRVDVLWPGTLINQLRIFALLAQFRL